jgi:hypothetical protein
MRWVIEQRPDIIEGICPAWRFSAAPARTRSSVRAAAR